MPSTATTATRFPTEAPEAPSPAGLALPDVPYSGPVRPGPEGEEFPRTAYRDIPADRPGDPRVLDAAARRKLAKLTPRQPWGAHSGYGVTACRALRPGQMDDRNRSGGGKVKSRASARRKEKLG